MTPPNVFLIVLDPLRADVMTARRLTPNLHSFAERGTRFLQCVSTSPIMTSAFATILTGAYPPGHGLRGREGYALAPNATTLAWVLGGDGYDTRADVTDPQLPDTGLLRDFDGVEHREVVDPDDLGWRDTALGATGRLRPPWFFLLHVAHVGLRDAWNEDAYRRAVAAIDESLAPALQSVDGNTITIITGARGAEHHGGTVQRALRRAAGRGWELTDHLVRVPLMITGPGVGRHTVEEQVRHVDLFPTLIDLCGLGVRSASDGRSLRPFLDGGRMSQVPAYLETEKPKPRRHRIAGARTTDWKLLKPERGRAALYSLNGSGGPNERRNVYSRYPEIARDLETFIESITVRNGAVAGAL